MTKSTKLAIIGSGPAGYTASIYASRYKVDNLIIGELPGGLASTAHRICNFPSEPAISGMDLMTNMQQHAIKLGAEEFTDRVIAIEQQKDRFLLNTGYSGEIEAQAILIAIGTKPRKLGLERESELVGRGVAYCATCDGMFYKDKVVAVIGGSDAATTASVYLSEIAAQVYQIYRKDKLRGEVAWIDQATSHDKIEIIYETNVTALNGADKLESLTLDKPYQGQDTLSVDGVFIEIGSEPDTSLADALDINQTDYGYITVDQAQRTNIPGIWAAGDITTNSNEFRQIITAASEGAVAAQDIYKSLNK